MDPIAFRIFGIDVAWYGVIISFGMFLGVLVAMHRAKKEGLHEDTIIDLVLLAVPAAIVGARLYYVIFNWEYYGQHPLDIIKIRQGGLAIHGAIIVGALVGYLFCRYRRLSFWRIADVCAPSIILGQAIGRWGNYVNQEAYGRPTNLPWAIEVNGVKVHPTFLYESLWNFAVFIFLLYLTGKKKFSGQIFLYYLIFYSLGRFFIEGLRIDSLMLGPFRVAQLVSAAAIVGALVIMQILKRKSKLTLHDINKS